MAKEELQTLMSSYTRARQLQAAKQAAKFGFRYLFSSRRTGKIVGYAADTRVAQYSIEAGADVQTVEDYIDRCNQR